MSFDGLTFICPVCGEEVPRKAKACPGCGACEKSGWSQDRYLDGIDLPGEDYGQTGRLGYGSRQTARQRFWMIVAIVIIVAMGLLTLRGMW